MSDVEVDCADAAVASDKARLLCIGLAVAEFSERASRADMRVRAPEVRFQVRGPRIEMESES